jgi:diamine N-acetyltransferase
VGRYGVSMIASQPEIRFVEVDATNWRSLSEVEPRPEQRAFVAPVTWYLCLAHYGGVWHPLAIEADGKIVGHVMWAVEEEDGSTWLGGLVVDAAYQRRGIGKAAVEAFLDRFSEGGKTNVALTISPDNEGARSLYRGLGFVETGEMDGHELVARYRTG